MNPKVSVIVASYNYAKYIVDTLNSILNQDFKDFEIIVVDDGSTDNSLQVIQKFVDSDPRVKLYTHLENKNQGLLKTLQLGLEKSQGEWIAFLESDDMWKSTCLSKRMAALAKSNWTCGWAFNATLSLVMPGASADWFNSYVPRIMEKAKSLATPDGAVDLSEPILYENLVPTFSSAMVRRDLLMSCHFDCKVPRWLDWYLWIQMSQKSKAAIVPEGLTLWRLHADSWNNRKTIKSYLRQYFTFRQQIQSLKLCPSEGLSVQEKKHLLGRSPWYFLFMRFNEIAKREGITGTIRKILKRLR
jgi:glycosyltransferase involved in cell wall biosynthesis